MNNIRRTQFMPLQSRSQDLSLCWCVFGGNNTAGESFPVAYTGSAFTSKYHIARLRRFVLQQ